MTILDFLNIDLNTFTEGDFEIGHSGENSQGDRYVDYEKFLFPKSVNIFDKLILKIFAGNFQITKDTDINLILLAERKEPSLDQIKGLVNLLHTYFGKDSQGNTRWNSNDILNSKHGVFHRHWDLKIDDDSLSLKDDNTYTIDISYSPKNAISVYSGKEYFSLLILGVNKIIDKPCVPIETPKTISKKAANKNGKQGCFIATACYGDYNSPEVLVFRRFRDETLVLSRLGRSVIKFYYRISPFLAKRIANSPFLKVVTRNIFLNPIKSIIERKSRKR
ncbi:MAG: CFI-box-CTERM domain-containing protein [Prolixibacteraceae bacterium]